MIEQVVEQQALKMEAIRIVDRLTETALNHERTYPSSIQAVLVFSGPGTYYDRLKQGQQERQRWMDRDRIRAGVAVVRQVAASVKTELSGRRFRVSDIDKIDVHSFGPFLVYNGIPIENEVFLRALESPFCKMPPEKVVVINQVKEENGSTHSIRHSGDQVKSLFQEVADPKSILYGAKNIAFVAHIPDFIRIPFYIQKYSSEYVDVSGQELHFWFYALKSRSNTMEEHMNAELTRLVEYAKLGQLDTTPCAFAV